MEGQSVPGLLPGGYKLGQALHKGGEWDLYEVFHPRIPGRYLAKVLARALARDAKEVKAFRADAELAASLRHPNIVQVFDVNQLPDGRPFLVMEHLEGIDLESRLAGQAGLPMPEVLAVVKGVAAGLQAAHQRGVVHRDLRPANVFLVPVEGHEGGFVKILNFGMSNLRSSHLMGQGNVHFVGEPHYMSPEQALGRFDQIDGRTDEFALAVIAFRMLTGIEAFRGDDPLAVLYQVVHEHPRSLSFRSTYPPHVDAVVQRGLAKSKEERYPTVIDFARAFEIAVTVPAQAPTPVQGTQPVPHHHAPSSGDELRFADVSHDDGPGFDDDVLDDVDGLVKFQRRWPRRVAMLAVLGLAGYVGLRFAGHRLPSEWRRHPAWHAAHLPHAVSDEPPAAPAPAAPDAGVRDAGAGDAAVEAGRPLPLAAEPSSGATIVPTPPEPPPPPPPAAPVAPAAAPVAAPVPVPVEGASPVVPEPVRRPPKRAARRDYLTPSARHYIWSDKQQKLVPVEGPSPVPVESP